MIAQLAPLAPTKPPKKQAFSFAAEWNDRKPHERKKLMQAAGYQAHHHWSYRAWSFIPFAIREDVIAVLKKQKRASTPPPAAQAHASSAPVRKPYWWEKEKDLGAANE